jgi:hypothetical protein
MKLRTKALPWFVVAMLLVGSASAARADMMANLAKTTPKERAGIQTAFMKSKLGLQEAELAKVAAINLEYAEKAEPVIKGSDGPFMKMRQMKEIQGQKDTALKGVLTPDQFQAYEAAREEMKQKFEEAIEKKAAGGS